MDVWAEFHSHFDTDDGSLPEVQLHDLGSAGIVAACELLIQLGGTPRPDYSAWDRREERDRKDLPWLDTVRGVVDNHFEGFTSVFNGISVSGTTLPELGVFVFDDEIALYYRMGQDWNAQTVTAFLELLIIMLAVSPTARLVPDRTIDQAPFMNSWNAFRQERSSQNSRIA